MAENPLLPNAEILSLLALLRQAFERAEGTKTGPAARPVVGREALFSATLMQLGQADGLVLSEPELTWVRTLLASRTKQRPGKLLTATVPDPAAKLMTAAGMAAAMIRTPSSHALSFTALNSGGVVDAWQEALQWAVADNLPLVVACADPSGEAAFQTQPPAPADLLTWTALRKLANTLALPVLTVDGEDAVAVYRTMQESVLRARARGGPALLWAVLPSTSLRSRKKPAALNKLEAYLTARNLPV